MNPKLERESGYASVPPVSDRRPVKPMKGFVSPGDFRRKMIIAGAVCIILTLAIIASILVFG